MKSDFKRNRCMHMLDWKQGGPFFRFSEDGSMTIHETAYDNGTKDGKVGGVVTLTQEQWVALFNHLKYEVGDKDGRIVYP